jgi:hypothetical protein
VRRWMWAWQVVVEGSRTWEVMCVRIEVLDRGSVSFVGTLLLSMRE